MASPLSLNELLEGVPPEKLDAPCKDGHLCEIALSITNWEVIAPFLGISTAEAEVIKDEGKKVHQKICMLRKWKEKWGRRATYQRLAEGFLKVKRKDLVDEICKVLGGSIECVVENILDKYADHLQRKYPKEIPSFAQWPPPPTHTFFNLAMIQKSSIQLGPIDEHYIRLTQRGNVDDIMLNKTAIQVKDIFDLYYGSSKRVIVLVEGAPGAGKSTLAWYICDQWGSGKLFVEFKLVVFVQLRSPAVQFATSIADLLPRMTSGQEREVLSHLETRFGRDVLFILDGWDEYSGGLSPESICGKLIHSPVDLNMQESTLLITSRPVASGELQQYCSTRIEIVGFSPEELKYYFRDALRVAHREQQAEVLQECLKVRPVIQASCYLPLSAAIIVHLFITEGSTLPTTLYGLFTSFVLNCIVRHLKKAQQEGSKCAPKITSFKTIPIELQPHFNAICALAYHGIMTNKASFSEEELHSFHLSTDSSAPLLSLIQGWSTFKSSWEDLSYSFFHLSVQELLAAFHISKQQHIQQVEIFRKLFGQPRFAAVLNFYAAFTKFHIEGTREFIKEALQTTSFAVWGDEMSTLPPIVVSKQRGTSSRVQRKGLQTISGRQVPQTSNSAFRRGEISTLSPMITLEQRVTSSEYNHPMDSLSGGRGQVPQTRDSTDGRKKMFSDEILPFPSLPVLEHWPAGIGVKSPCGKLPQINPGRQVYSSQVPIPRRRLPKNILDHQVTILPGPVQLPKKDLHRTILDCLFEAQDPELCQYLATVMEGKLTVDYTMSPFHCMVLGYFLHCLCLTPGGAKLQINFVNTDLDEYKCSYLVNELKKCIQGGLSLSLFQGGKSDRVLMLVSMLQESCSHCITDLSLSLPLLAREHMVHLLKHSSAIPIVSLTIRVLRAYTWATSEVSPTVKAMYSEYHCKEKRTTTPQHKPKQELDPLVDFLTGNGQYTLTELKLLGFSVTNEIGLVLATCLIPSSVLQALDLSKCTITLGSLIALAASLAKGSSSLKTLNLSWCTLPLGSMAVLAGSMRKNPTLKTLNLSHSTISLEDAAALATGLVAGISKLDVLVLECKPPESAGILAVALAVRSHQETWDLSGHTIPLEGMKMLGASLTKNSTLKTLNLSRCTIQPKGLSMLTDCLSKIPVMRELNFSQCQMSQENMLALAQAVGGSGTLETLVLSDTCVEHYGSGVDHLIHAFTLKPPLNLKLLDVSWSRLPLQGARALEPFLAANQILEVLILSYNKLSCASGQTTGAHFLAQGLKRNKSLKSLSIVCCGLTNDTLEVIVEALEQHPSLQELDFSGNLPTDRDFQAFKERVSKVCSSRKVITSAAHHETT